MFGFRHVEGDHSEDYFPASVGGQVEHVAKAGLMGIAACPFKAPVVRGGRRNLLEYVREIRVPTEKSAPRLLYPSNLGKKAIGPTRVAHTCCILACMRFGKLEVNKAVNFR